MQITPREAIPVTDTKIIGTPGTGSITQNNYFGGGAIAKSTATTPKPSKGGGVDWVALSVSCVIAYVFVAAGLSLAWLGGQAFNEWNAYRETSAQTELTRIRNCIN